VGINVPIEFHVKYDKSVDALYIRLRDGRIVESDEVTPGIIVDFNENNEVIGIEILHVSKRKLDLLKLLMEGPEALVAIA